MNSEYVSYSFLRLLILLLTVISLTACRTGNIRQGYKFDEKSEAAVIIGSVTQPEDAGLPTDAHFYVNYNGEDRKILFAKEQSALGYIGAVNEFENTGLFGRIFVIELPAGQHSINHWSIKYGDASGFTLYPKVAPPPLAFTLKPGQIMYLGNFHMNIETGEGMLGQTLPVTGIPIIMDKSDRDIKLFKGNYPELASHEVIINVLHSGAWVSETQEDEELVIPKSE